MGILHRFRHRKGRRLALTEADRRIAALERRTSALVEQVAANQRERDKLRAELRQRQQEERRRHGGGTAQPAGP